MWILFLILFLCYIKFSKEFNFHYYHYEEMTELLQNVTENYKNISRLYSIGKSKEDRELWVIEITNFSKVTIGTPNIKLVGNIHGNEVIGRQLLLYLLEYLLVNNDRKTKIKWLLDNSRIHLLPSLNPDGFERAIEGKCIKGPGRRNAANIDLNRSFPDFRRINHITSEPETIAVQNWMNETAFVLSASLHGGALVARYPYDNADSEYFASRAHVTPDDDVFQHLATVYAVNHKKMHLKPTCYYRNEIFDKGIVNGASWYPHAGGMADYNYVFHGCMEVTLEISCCKYPLEKELSIFWDNNRLALINYLFQVHQGVKGIIIDGETNKSIENANLQIIGRNIRFHSTENGEFWRILLPGKYELKVSVFGYRTEIVKFVVDNYKRILKPTWLEVKIYPVQEYCFNCTTCIKQKLIVILLCLFINNNFRFVMKIRIL